VAEVSDKGCGATDPGVIEIGDEADFHPAAMTAPSEMRDRLRWRSMRRRSLT
jgi:hypothetical protein